MLLFFINTAVFIVICTFTFKNEETFVDFIPSDSDSFVPSTSSRYEVRKKNFEFFDLYEGIISENEEMYSIYSVNSYDCNIGSIIKKDEQIGKSGDNIVYAVYDSICIDISTDLQNNNIVKFYNYNQFSIEITLSVKEYTGLDFNNIENIYLNGNGLDYNVSFIGYDYQLLEEKSVITAIFKPLNCDSFITKKSEISIKVKKREYLNQFYLPSSVFNDSLCSKSFYIIEGDEYKLVYIEVIHLIDNYAIIQSDSNLLVEGLYLYL